MHTIGLDVGTTGCKACIIDPQGTIKGEAFRPYGVISTEPGMGEQDANLVWNLTRKMLAEAVAASGVAESIVAVSISVQGDAIIPTDQNCNPVYNAVLGMDYRSEPQARYCADSLGDRRLFNETGMRPHPMNSVVKMLWLKEQRPDAYSSAVHILTYADFVSAKLCGRPVMDYTMASRTMCFDLEKKVWSAEILDSLGIDSALLSETAPSGTIVGTISPSLAQDLGLPASVAVVTGGHDQTCAAIGAGAIAPGIAVISTGTAEVLSTTFAKKNYKRCHV